MFFRLLGYRKRQSGFSLPELMITLALMALGALMGFSMVMKKDDADQRARIMSDYINHLTSACQIVRSKYGTGPLKATYYDDTSTDCPGSSPCNCVRYKFTDDNATSVVTTDLCELNPDNDKNNPDHPQIPYTYVENDDYRGFEVFLPDWESGVSQFGWLLRYPGNMAISLRADEPAIDPDDEIPDNNNHSGAPSFKHDDIMKTVDDREWLLVDMDGFSNGPDSIAATGDRVLLHVNNETCKVLTAKQKCDQVEATNAGDCDGTGETQFGQSFYDVFMGY